MKRVLFAIAAMAMCVACCEGEKGLPLEGTKWNLTELQGATNEAFDDADTFWFVLNDGDLIGIGACNNFFGGCMLTGKDGFKIGGMGMTRMACHNMDLEDAYVRMLDEADNYEIEGDILSLKRGDDVLAKFKGELRELHSEPQNESEAVAEPAPETTPAVE